MAKSFLELSECGEKDVLLIDSLNLCFRYFVRKQFDFASEFLNTAQSLAKSYHCGKIIFAADKGSSTFRRNIFPEYKGNRKKEDQTDQEKQEFLDFIQGYEEALAMAEDEGYTVLRYQGVEADDIIAYVCKNKVNFDLNKIWIVSSDKDLDLLLTEDISRWSYVTRKDYTLGTWHYDFSQEDYIGYKCLVGDSGDNVPGVPGIGPKRATSLIQEYGSIFEIIDSIPLPGKQKFIQNLNQSKDQLLLNVELMDLLSFCETAIGPENLKDIQEKLRA